MRACSMSEQDSHIPLDRRTFLRWLSRWWRGQYESGSPSFSISYCFRLSFYRVMPLWKRPDRRREPPAGTCPPNALA
jgi:hypothetical protein